MSIQCPVPKHQRPLSEYNELKNSFGFRWISEKPTLFFKVALMFLGISVSCIILLILLNFKWQNQYLDSFLGLTCFFVLISTLWVVRLYLSWLYIYDRLMNATVTYEESGWYDGQTWIKTNEILLQDRLVGTYEVFPILKQLRLLLYFCVASIIITLYINSWFNI